MQLCDLRSSSAMTVCSSTTSPGYCVVCPCSPSEGAANTASGPSTSTTSQTCASQRRASQTTASSTRSDQTGPRSSNSSTPSAPRSPAEPALSTCPGNSSHPSPRYSTARCTTSCSPRTSTT